MLTVNYLRFSFPATLIPGYLSAPPSMQQGPGPGEELAVIHEGHPQPPQGMHQACVFLAQTTCLCSWCTSSRLQATQGTWEKSGSWSYGSKLPRPETRPAAVTRHFLKTQTCIISCSHNLRTMSRKFATFLQCDLETCSSTPTQRFLISPVILHYFSPYSRQHSGSCEKTLG